jgi:hypothetical protein
MTDYTEDQFATRVLKDLGLVAAEETPSAADLEWAKETAGSEITMLSALNLPIWNGSELSIPQEYLTTLSRRVGLAVAPSFGLADMATAQMAMREAERSLTLLAAPRGLSPSLLRSDDSMPRRGGFNFTRGY